MKHAARKREVAHLDDVDPESYVDAKADVVAELLATARRTST